MIVYLRKLWYDQDNQRLTKSEYNFVCTYDKLPPITPHSLNELARLGYTNTNARFMSDFHIDVDFAGETNPTYESYYELAKRQLREIKLKELGI